MTENSRKKSSAGPRMRTHDLLTHVFLSGNHLPYRYLDFSLHKAITLGIFLLLGLPKIMLGYKKIPITKLILGVDSGETIFTCSDHEEVELPIFTQKRLILIKLLAEVFCCPTTLTGSGLYLPCIINTR